MAKAPLFNFGICCEGPTDFRFLNPLIKRIVWYFLSQYSKYPNGPLPNIFEEDEPIPHKIVGGESNSGRILAEKYAQNFTLIILHADSDKEHPAEARENRLRKPLEAAIQHIEEQAQPTFIVALLAITEIEAWLLADPQALDQAVGKPSSGFWPAQNPEEIRSPKEIIASILKDKQLGMELGGLYDPLGQYISLNSLKRLTAFRAFVEDLRAALIQKGWITKKCPNFDQLTFDEPA